MIQIIFSLAIWILLLTAFSSCGCSGGTGSSGGSDSDDGKLYSSPICPDEDGDGYADAFCGGVDCDDTDPNANPVAHEICGDNIDQNYDGSDKICSGAGAAAHASLTWDGNPGICLTCHIDEAQDMYASTHYQWQGDAFYMAHGPQKQGKIAIAVNSYCINILGNWTGCSNCHVGLGALPRTAEDPTQTQLENIAGYSHCLRRLPHQ